MSQQLRLQTILHLVLSQDANQKKTIIKMLEDGAIVIDDFSSTAVEHVVSSFTLAAGETDFDVPFGKVVRASSVLLVGEDGDFEWKFDNNANTYVACRGLAADITGSPVSSYAAARQPGMLFHRGRVSSVRLKNSSGSSPVTIFVMLVGNAAA